MFSNLTWICGHIGFANDSLTVFFNLHNDKSINYAIVRDRMRCSKPGLLLNWAWYYPWWKYNQYSNASLQQQLYLNDQSRFAQAHFVMREGDLLSKFPGSKTLTILVEDTRVIEYYIRYAHYKLLDKTLYNSWYEVQKKNYPIQIKENQVFADHMFKKGMTALQYRSIVFQDWQEKLVQDCADPIECWDQVSYHTNFMENKNTVIIDNQSWKPLFVAEKQHPIYIDKLVNPITKTLNDQYYLELCNLLDLTPNLAFFQEYWQQWLAGQPNIATYSPMLNWKLTAKS
jgi:hypothetical protein